MELIEQFIPVLHRLVDHCDMDVQYRIRI